MTTGLEVVKPINARSVSVAIPTATRPRSIRSSSTPWAKNGALDKAGKDNNYRGITEFGGALYFTKGSGSNGMDTVYTVSSLPTVADAAAATISVVPGFPMDSARCNRREFHALRRLLRQRTTMYVTDEGTGSSTDRRLTPGCRNGAWSTARGNSITC